jgi:hypothetical protein
MVCPRATPTTSRQRRTRVTVNGVGIGVATAAAQTVAARTARLFAAWSKSSVPEAADRRCEGVADFATRRAHVRQVLLWKIARKVGETAGEAVIELAADITSNL